MANQFGQGGVFIGAGDTFGFGPEGVASTVTIETKAGAAVAEPRGPGSLIIDTTNGKLYITQTSTNWELVTSA